MGNLIYLHMKIFLKMKTIFTITSSEVFSKQPLRDFDEHLLVSVGSRHLPHLNTSERAFFSHQHTNVGVTIGTVTLCLSRAPRSTGPT